MPTSRKEALMIGASHYFTGKPCKNGHLVPRHVSGNCPECLKQAHRRRTEDYAAWILKAKQANAKARGIEFSLQQKDIVIPDKCPVLGIPLKKSISKGDAGNSPSIDRVDPSKGYTPDNIRIISHRANRKKQDCTVEELRLLLAYMES
ncbi:MAG: hypothetical protein IBX55_13985 [Methyloprofundus sp.]|nr:hypothetical protein [Methyloprofundus sp.]